MDKLQNIIKNLKFICSQEGLSISPETILEQSVKIMLSEKIQKNKQENIKLMKEDNKPTDKQINLLKKLKLPIPKTKKEATILIKENINSPHGQGF